MTEILETMLMKVVIGVGLEEGIVCIVLQDGTEVYLEGVSRINVTQPERLQ